MDTARRGITGLALAAIFGAAVAGIAALAQDVSDVPPRPVSLRLGSCDDLGEAVEALGTATLPENVALERIGPEAATLAETSFATIPLTLDALLAEPHALAVAGAEDDPDALLACGEVGGIIDENGALTLGLREWEGSGYAGIAYLFPSEESPSTLASIFVAPSRGPGEAIPAGTPVPQVIVQETVVMGSDGTPVVVRVERTPTPAPPTPTPTPTPIAGAIDVTISESTIGMPERLLAGPVVFTITNDGTEPHNFVFANDFVGSFFLDADLQPGETGTLSVNLPPGIYTAYCPLGDGEHATNGEQLTIEVVE